MRLHRWLLIMGLMLIPALLASCGQQRSTAGGTNATPVLRAWTGAVSLRVGATSYHPTETISVTLSHQSTQAIYFLDHLTNCTVIQLQRRVDGNWENVNMCLLLTAMRLHKLDAGKRLTVALVSSAARPWAVGLYHTTLRYRSSRPFGGPTTSIASAGFQVVP